MLVTLTLGIVVHNRLETLRKIDAGELVPEHDSRLGAYASSKGFAPGTIGRDVHTAIGLIYVVFGTFGEQKIGSVFGSERARERYSLPIADSANYDMVMDEFNYWLSELPSAGALIAVAFPPQIRWFLQRFVFKYNFSMVFKLLELGK